MKRLARTILLALCGAAGSLFAVDRHFGALRGEGYSVSERELHVDNRARKRSGHMGHALIDCGRGRILAFNSNCDHVRSAGHSGYGWMEYRISTDYGRTFGPVRTLGYSRRLYEEGRHTAICEKGVCLPDGRIVLFFQITDTSKDICCEPWSAPTMVVSTDGGETFSDGVPTGADPGRIYDALVHEGRVYFITMANDASKSFLGNAPEHVYKLWSAGPDLKFVPTVLPFDGTGRAYCTMDFAEDGALHVYVYNSKCETRIDYAVSRDMGKTWSALKSASVPQKIRGPQVRRLGDRWFLSARNGGDGDGLVLYSSRDGLTWDDGLKVDERPAGGKTAYYSCLLPVLEPGKPPRMLLQYSHVYGTKPADCNCVNVIHRWITPDGNLHLVIPDEGPGTGRKEFCDLWRRMTGREPVVMRESEFTERGRAVWLGDTEKAKASGAGNAVLKREEIVVKTLADGGVIVNGRNAYGIMSAMYEFFEGLGAAYWRQDALQMEEMARAIGRTEDAAWCAASAERAMAHLRSMLEDGRLPSHFRELQTANLFALRLGVFTDPERVDEAKATLLKNIAGRKHCLATGFLGTAFILDELVELDETETAYSLLLSHGFPSWLYEVDQGATTVWERWNSYTKKDGFGPVGMNSFNHYAYGAIVAWLYRCAAGIATDPKNPGFKNIIMAPKPDRRLGYVRAEYNSAAGLIKSAWHYEGDTWVWEFTVPAGATADVTLPGEKDSRHYMAGSHAIRG